MAKANMSKSKTRGGRGPEGRGAGKMAVPISRHILSKNMNTRQDNSNLDLMDYYCEARAREFSQHLNGLVVMSKLADEPYDIIVRYKGTNNTSRINLGGTKTKNVDFPF